LNKRPSASIVLLCISAFLLPLWGGQIATDRLPLGPGTLWQALAGGAETPLLTHALLGALIASAAGIALWRRRILQVPGAFVSIPLVVLGASVLCSVFLSAFKSYSWPAALEWLVFCMTAFATTMVLGRREGPRWYLGSLVAGCSVVAILAILEFQRERIGDPGYRVFGGWVNPNALAGILMIGILTALGLCASLERRASLLCGVAVAIQCLALWLTGSRAGFLATAAGVLAFLILIAAWRVPWKSAAKPAGALLAGAILVGLLVVSNRSHAAADPNAPSGPNRAVAGLGVQDQSSEFRKLLYRGAIELIKERPLGYGAGTYRFYSAKPGLTTQTQYTHDTYLQLAVEAGPLAILALLVAVAAWLWTMCKGARKLLPDQNGLRAGVTAAVIASLAQGVFESNLFYFGLGTVFFSLLGTGLLIAGDGVAPEFMTRPFRQAGVAIAGLVILGLGYFGVAEMHRAEARAAIQDGNLDDATSQAKTALGMIPGDADALGLLARLTPASEGLEYAKQAVEAGPNTSALRRLAELQKQAGDTLGSLATLSRALELDSKNLLTLRQMLLTQVEAKDLTGARATAESMIRVEGTPYYRVRSLPELIPTETFEARVFLAGEQPDPLKKIPLLRGALEGYVRYAITTVPPVIRLAGNYGDETTAKAKQKIELARQMANDLKQLYRTAGDAAGVTWVEGVEPVLTGAAERLNK